MDPVFNSSTSAPGSTDKAPAPFTGHAGSSGHNAKPLWAAVGVLGVAVAALGGTLVWQNARGPATPEPLASTAATPTTNAAGGPVVTAPSQQLAREDLVEQRAPVAVAPKPVVVPRPVPVRAPVHTASNGYTGTYGATPAVSRTPVCTVCGRVESVTPIQQAAPASGLGAVAGGVLGAVLGNQVGHGNGRTAATLLGAGGGAYLGNTVEKRTRTTTTYEVRVHMDDGSTRTFSRAQPVPVGERITLEGNGFRAGTGQSYSTSSSQPYYQQVNEPQGTYTTSRY